MANIRLDKYLSEMSCGTRSEVKLYIRKGQVTVNGEIVKKPEYKVSSDEDEVSLNGSVVGYTEMEYLMLNKPQGVVSATEDRYQKTVLDLIEGNSRKDLFPVGRLDKDTEGLLLLTNDGKLAHDLLSPKKHVPKTYFAIVDGRVTEEDQKLFHEGFQVDDELFSKPAELVVKKSGEQSEVLLTIVEGKFHQVKRMFQAVDKPVLFLKRMTMGSLELDPTLGPGEYRKLTIQELSLLRER